jgi:hypothetical protein
VDGLDIMHGTGNLTDDRVSKLLQKLNTFPYTPYVEECCVSLCERYEYATDEHLYYIVRLQNIMETIDSVSLQRNSGAAARNAIIQTKSQLESFSAHLAFDLNDNREWSGLDGICVAPSLTNSGQTCF